MMEYEPTDETATEVTIEDAERYRKMFWESREEQEKVANAMEYTNYKGFFTHENIRKWAESIKDRDVAFRLGYTLGFSELAVNIFTGIFHIDYDRKADSMFHDAIYEFICNYLNLNPNETDFRFYRRVREVLKLSSMPFDIYGCPREAQISLKERIKKETYEDTMKYTFRNKYEDHFMRWLLKEFDKKKSDCLKVFGEISKSTGLKRYKHILCLDDIDTYFKRVQEKKTYEEKLKIFNDYTTKFYSNKITAENKKKESEVKPITSHTSSPDNKQSPTSKKESFPEYPTEPTKAIECPLFTLIKIYSTIKGYLMTVEKDEVMENYSEKLRKVFSRELIHCFFPVERNLKPKTECTITYNKRLFTDYHFMNIIRVIDSRRLWNGDILRSLRDHNLELEKKFPNCRWLRTFRVLCIWNAKWPKNKFSLTLDRFLLHKDFVDLAEFRDLMNGGFVRQKNYIIKGIDIDKMF